MDTTPVIIEVALNGTTTRERNPHVPISREELIEEGLACIEAGATIIHCHIANMRVAAAEAAAEYRATFEPWVAADPDVLVLPTLGWGQDMSEKLGHLEYLAEGGLQRLGFIDPGTMILGKAGANGLPDPNSHVYINTYSDMEVAIEQCNRLGLGMHFAIFEPGFLRNVLSYWRYGQLTPGSFVKFYLGGPGGYFAIGDSVSFGLPPTEKALDAYLEMLELAGCDLPWFAAVVGGDLIESPIPQLTLERGGHLRVGHEDYAGDRPRPNHELVAEVAALAADMGRPVATSAQAVEILGLPARQSAGV
ncbi:MAG: 3-keto-5-aminohexanoate cleavage protein [Acidimicrobiia bacterium]|nr:3-keto-5-aminohexanoate cleavage protein [Acidimicrobiia bacterium]